MRLTREQRRLRDDGTPAQRKAMQILLALSHLSEAERLVPITSAHVSGASYKMIGDPGLEFLEDFARDARVTVPTTVNPLGTDLRQWRDLGIPAEFADKQERIARAYGSMGVRPSFTCTPYLVGARPGFGEHVAWAESNAVCFANSVLGARTNREGGPSALAAAIVGATPDYGLHKDEGRRPTVRVKVDIPRVDNAWGNDMFTNLADALELQSKFEAVPIPPNRRAPVPCSTSKTSPPRRGGPAPQACPPSRSPGAIWSRPRGPSRTGRSRT